MYICIDVLCMHVLVGFGWLSLAISEGFIRMSLCFIASFFLFLFFGTLFVLLLFVNIYHVRNWDRMCLLLSISSSSSTSTSSFPYSIDIVHLFVSSFALLFSSRSSRSSRSFRSSRLLSSRFIRMMNDLCPLQLLEFLKPFFVNWIIYELLLELLLFFFWFFCFCK